MLIDNAIRHYREWIFIGTNSTAHWGHNMMDITNQFIGEGVNGGIIPLILFTIMIFWSFIYIGVGWKFQENKRDMFFVWSLGCALAVHIASFTSVSYFGQIFILWYLSLAISANVLKKKYLEYKKEKMTQKKSYATV